MSFCVSFTGTLCDALNVPCHRRASRVWAHGVAATPPHAQGNVAVERTRVVEAGDETIGEPDLVIELADGQNARVAADLDLLRLHHDRQTGEKIKANLAYTLSNHHRPPCLELVAVAWVVHG